MFRNFSRELFAFICNVEGESVLAGHGQVATDDASAKLNQIEAFSTEPRRDRVEEFRGHVRHLIEMLVWGEREGQSFVG